MSEEKKVTRAAGIVGAATLLSRVLGFVRDMVMAKVFGAGMVADAFFVGFRIPNLLRELFAEGSMSAAFIPVFTEYTTQKTKDEAWRMASATFTILFLILIAVTALGIVAAPWIVRAIAPGFYDIPEKFALTATLTQIMFPYLIFIGLAALMMGILNTMRSFAAPALSPVMLNVAMISAALFVAPFMEQPIMALAIGVVVGGLLQFAVQFPALRRAGGRLSWRLEPSHPGVKQVGRLMIPSLFGLSVTQLNIFIGTILASFLAEGSVTYLFYGMRLIHFPLGIFGIALATAILPTLSAYAARQEDERLRETVSFGLRLIFFLTIPAMAALIALREPITSFLFQRGAFLYKDTLGTATAILYYSTGLWAFAGVRVVASAFYAMKDTRTPVKVASVALVVNVGLSLALMSPLGHGGLAMATSGAAMVNFVGLVWLLRRKMGRIDGRRVVLSLLRISAASTFMGLAGWLVARYGSWEVSGHSVEKGLWLLLAFLVSGGIYLGIMKLLRSEELGFLWGMAQGKLRRKG